MRYPHDQVYSGRHQKEMLVSKNKFHDTSPSTGEADQYDVDDTDLGFAGDPCSRGVPDEATQSEIFFYREGQDVVFVFLDAGCADNIYPRSAPRGRCKTPPSVFDAVGIDLRSFEGAGHDGGLCLCRVCETEDGKNLRHWHVLLSSPRRQRYVHVLAVLRVLVTSAGRCSSPLVGRGRL